MFKHFSKRTTLVEGGETRIITGKTEKHCLCKFIMPIFRDWETNKALGKIKCCVLPLLRPPLCAPQNRCWHFSRLPEH